MDSTKHVEELIEKALDGIDIGANLKNLNEEDLKVYMELSRLLREDAGGAAAYMDHLWKVDYERRPPSMEEFITDPYWLGSVTVKTPDSKGLYPKWREVLISDFDVDSTVHNVVMSGSLGCGKTWVSTIILLYRVVLARLLRNPSAFFGLSKGSAIYYTILSLSKSVVQETAFGDAFNFMAHSPFFVSECKFRPDRKYAGLRVPVGRDVYVTAGSKGWHIIGRNVMGAFMDEGNFRLEKNPDVKAYELYNEVRTRIKNRFQTRAEYLPAISILASSARDETSFTQKVVDDIIKEANPDQKVYRFAAYDIKREELKVAGEPRFRVAYGLKNADPVVLSGTYTEEGEPLDGPFSPAPPGASIIYVPSRYLVDFKRNPSVSLQSISGVSTGKSFLLFSSTLGLEMAMEAGKNAGLVNPSMRQQIPLARSNDADLWDFLDHRVFVAKHASRFQPKRHPNAKRYCHIDLAATGKAGIAICHAVGRERIAYHVAGGEAREEDRMVIEYDFLLAIVQGDQQSMPIDKILRFLIWLRDKCGFHFACVTADTYQSLYLLELVAKNGFKTANLSLDRSKVPYYTWRDAIAEKRVIMFESAELMSEAEHLIDGPAKVDHPENKEKDVCDAAAGCCYTAMTFKGEDAVATAEGVTPSIFTNIDFEDKGQTMEVVDMTKYQRPVRHFSA